MLEDLLNDKTLSLEQKFKQYRNLIFLGVILAIVGMLSHIVVIATGSMANQPAFIEVLSILMIGFGGALAKFANKHYNILKSGLHGEKRTETLLNQLKGEYEILTNVNIHHDGRRTELDSLVIGPNGVFLVESKNVKGKISGRTDDQTYRKVSISSSGNTYESTMNNPVRQINRAIIILKNYLQEENGLHTYIQGILYFSNPETTVKIENTSNVQIFSAAEHNGKDLISYVKNYQPKKPLTAKDIQQIKQALTH